MNTFGLVGYPLTHSFSKQYFTEKFSSENIYNSKYENFSLTKINEITTIFQDPYIMGLNVTIPYKETIIPYLDGLSEAARNIGAVNTIKRINDKWIGYNTDYYGFQRSWESLLMSHHSKALVLGTGGAAKSVWYVLQQKKIPYLKISRNKSADSITYNDITEEIIQNYTVIINTTPLGMYPNIADYPPIPYNMIDQNHYLYDLVYNPTKTTFLQKGEKQGAVIKSGMDMLYYQADKAWEIWNNQ